MVEKRCGHPNVDQYHERYLFVVVLGNGKHQVGITMPVGMTTGAQLAV
jgi:hypothetical protein